MKTIGVVLSGCGVKDGSEIHEAVSVLLALAKRGAKAVCMAPDSEQPGVVDHATGAAVSETRNMLTESARIARGRIIPLSKANLEELDAIILPGGFGAAVNLSDFASAGADMTIRPDVESLLSSAYKAGKPLCALCIAPPILAKLMQNAGVTRARLTIGNDPGTAAAIEAMGQTHVNTPASSALTDPDHRLVTCPAYMLATDVAQLYEGIDDAVQQTLDLLG